MIVIYGLCVWLFVSYIYSFCCRIKVICNMCVFLISQNLFSDGETSFPFSSDITISCWYYTPSHSHWQKKRKLKVSGTRKTSFAWSDLNILPNETEPIAASKHLYKRYRCNPWNIQNASSLESVPQKKPAFLLKVPNQINLVSDEGEFYSNMVLLQGQENRPKFVMQAKPKVGKTASGVTT